MARSKTKNVGSTTDNNTERNNKMAGGLTAEQIQALLGKTRTKGQYIVYLNKFVESGEAGICVNEEFADLASKKASTLKQGFEGAKNAKDAVEGAEFVKVVPNDDKVYLINLKAAGVAVEDES